MYPVYMIKHIQKVNSFKIENFTLQTVHKIHENEEFTKLKSEISLTTIVVHIFEQKWKKFGTGIWKKSASQTVLTTILDYKFKTRLTTLNSMWRLLLENRSREDD